MDAVFKKAEVREDLMFVKDNMVAISPEYATIMR